MNQEHLVQGRPPPVDLDCEAAVLSAVLIDSATLPEVLDVISPQDFYSESHRRILEAMVALHEAGSRVDIVTVGTQLKETGRIQQIGGMAYLTEILNSAPFTAHAAKYAETVKRFSNGRRILDDCNRTAARLYILEDGIDTILDEHERVVHDVSLGRGVESDLETMGTILKAALREDLAAADAGHKFRGYSTGIRAVDENLGGMHCGDLTVLAANPGQGKTAFALNIAMNMVDPALYPDAAVAFYSLEMPKKQLARRALASVAGVDLQMFRTAIPPAVVPRLVEASKYVNSLPIYITDRPNLSIQDIRASLRKKQAELHRKKKQLRLVVIDYLQIMKLSDASTEAIALGEVTKMCKVTAKEFDVPVMLLSQLNRANMNRDDKRPNVSDLRGSGSIEQDADNICFIFREEMYDKNNPALRGLAELNVPKQRNGPTGMIPLRFNGKTTTFYDMDATYDEQRKPY